MNPPATPGDAAQKPLSGTARTGNRVLTAAVPAREARLRERGRLTGLAAETSTEGGAPATVIPQTPTPVPHREKEDT